MQLHPGICRQNLYNLITENADADDDLNLDLINRIFDNLDNDEISAYHDIASYNSLVNEHEHSLILFHLNLRSLVKNLDNLDALLGSFIRSPDVIAVSESWLRPNNAQFYNIDGFTSYHVTRSNKKGGGASLLVKASLDSELIEQFSFVNEHIEICTVLLRIKCSISLSIKKFVIASIYRPHSKFKNVNNFSSVLTDILSSPLFLNNHVYILGDININLLELFLHKPTEQYLANIHSLNYFELISRPTRFPCSDQRVKPSLIDHIYTNSQNRSISGILTTSVSDHLPVFLIIPSIKPKKEIIKTKFRVFDNNSKAQFTRELAGIHWEEDLSYDTIDDNYNKFHNKFTEVYNRHFPVKTKTMSNTRVLSPWLSKGILISIKKKNSLYKQRQLSLITHHYFTTYEQKLSQIIQAAKKMFYLRYFSNFKMNLKKCWNTINNITDKGNKKSRTCYMKVNGITTNNPKQIAENFNSHFSSIASKLDNELPAAVSDPISYLRGDFPRSILVPPVRLIDIFKVLKSLKSKTANICDFSPQIIKDNAHLVAPAIKILYNQSLLCGSFPTKLKHAMVIPLHKSSSRNDVNNYRPISQLNIFSKIFEKLMKNKLSNYLSNHNIIHPSQFGFQAEKNTSLALQKFSKFVYSTLDTSNFVLGIFIDFAKAFDCVSHRLLLKKLEHYGIRGKILQWFESYLSNRTQSTIFEGHESKKEYIPYGVPQGSVLGPILFLIYISDLPNISNIFKYLLFADDSTLYISGKSPKELVELANSELPKLYYWCTANRLTLNISKTHYMIFSNKPIRAVLPPMMMKHEFEYRIITRVESFKFLGVIFDERLSFKYHTSYLTNKLSRIASMFLKVKKILPPFILRTLYFAHVNSILSYCINIWAGTNRTHLKSVITMQKRIIRIINNADFRDHTRPLFKTSNILNLSDLYKYNLNIDYFKNILPNLQPQNPVHHYYTRNRLNFRPDRHQRTIYEHSFMYNSPRFFNELPQRLRGLRTLHKFKSELKKYYISLY